MSLEHFQNNMKDINLKQTIQEIYNEISPREKEVDSLNLEELKYSQGPRFCSITSYSQILNKIKSLPLNKDLVNFLST